MKILINDILQNLRSLDFSQYPCSEIRQNISSLGSLGYVIYTLHPGKHVFRVRSGSGYCWKDKLSYPPEPSNEYQRASTPNKAMFYGSITGNNDDDMINARLISSLESCRLLREGIESVGIERLTYSRWLVTKDINLIAIVSNRDYQKENPLLEELSTSYQMYVKQFPDKEDDCLNFSNYLAEEFSKENSNNKDYNYLFSAIFTEIVTSHPEIDGVLYPSVKTFGSFGFNIAITTKCADENLKLDVAGEATLYKNKCKTYIESDSVCLVEDETKKLVYTPVESNSIEYRIRCVGITDINKLT